MEIGLKERLIGAVVLVVLGVIIIPFFLKGSPAPDTNVSQQLTLPPSDSTAPQQQYSLPLTGGTAAGPATALVPASTAPAPAPAAAPTQPPVHTIARAPQPAAKPAAKPAAAPVTSANGKWLVQAGSYGSQANADKVVKTLKAHGFSASVSRFSKAGQTYYRVRLGPYTERADADKTAAAVSKALAGKASVVPND
jgi:DedD protein